MKSKQHGGFGIEVAIFLVIMAVIVTFVIWLIEMLRGDQCEARWKDSGMKAEYRVDAGCMVQKPDGRWLPARAIREPSI